MGFNIVLVEPEIPMNTGNIGRLSLASGSVLHLVKPFGFESVGLTKNILDENSDKVYKIPIYSEHVRSLNLANAVSIVVYDGLKTIG
jgi:tRNA(Leu) C34 or U34 (ribose-2'-O)-methylase TrmL